jgi:hypothetical protein
VVDDKLPHGELEVEMFQFSIAVPLVIDAERVRLFPAVVAWVVLSPAGNVMAMALTEYVIVNVLVLSDTAVAVMVV